MLNRWLLTVAGVVLVSACATTRVENLTQAEALQLYLTEAQKSGVYQESERNRTIMTCTFTDEIATIYGDRLSVGRPEVVAAMRAQPAQLYADRCAERYERLHSAVARAPSTAALAPDPHSAAVVAPGVASAASTTPVASKPLNARAGAYDFKGIEVGGPAKYTSTAQN